MPTMPCDCKVVCPGTDSPFANLTAEIPDVLVKIGYSWGWDNNVPPLGGSFDQKNVFAFCDSPLSQQDADLCAAQQQLNCVATGTCGQNTSGGAGGGNSGWTTGNGSKVGVFQNASAFCTVNCPDGNPFTYTVRSGLFTALDQISADRMAIALACSNARVFAVCLGNINTGACLGQPYIAVFQVSGGLAPYSFIIQSGSLPPGVGFVQDTPFTAFLSGQPSISGSYTFILRVTDSRGNFMTKAYTIYVLDVTNRTSLAFPSVGVAYSQQILMTGGVAPYVFSNASGLPTGLTIDPSGLISGTPTVSATGPFSVKVTDSLSNTCTFSLSFVKACSFFNTISWTAPVIVLPAIHVPPNSGSIAPSFPAGNQLQVSGSTSIVLAADLCSSIEYAYPTVDPHGYSGNCSVRITNASVGGGTIIQVRIYTQGFASLILDTNPTQLVVANGTFDFSFTIPPGTTQLLLDPFINFGAAGTEFAPYSASGTVTITFGV